MLVLIVLTALTSLSMAAAPTPPCPVLAVVALPELQGSWEVRMISRLERAKPDTLAARATIAADLQSCLLREQLVARAGSPPYEALILWGVNGADTTVQRVFAHSQHGRIGFYQGSRSGNSIDLRQIPLSSQPSNVQVQNQVLIRDRDTFTITSRLSEDSGQTWQALSRWEYQRIAP